MSTVPDSAFDNPRSTGQRTARWLATPTGALAALCGGLLVVAVLVDRLAWLIVSAAVLLILLLARVAAAAACAYERLSIRTSEQVSALAASLAEARAEAQREQELRTEFAERVETMAAELAATTQTASEASADVRQERSDRSLMVARVNDPGYPIRRVLLQFTIHRSGSTRLFDLLRTHPAVRMDPSMEVWRRLELKGRRYPEAFSDVPGAYLPVEVQFGVGTAIPELPHAALPGPTPELQWVVEKAHPQFSDFDAARLAVRIADMQNEGVEIQILHGVRDPVEAMWSMFDFKARQPSWYVSSGTGDIPAWILRSLESLHELHGLCGGLVIDYDDLPDGPPLRHLASKLAPEWGSDDVDSWLEFATRQVDPADRPQRAGAGFMGPRSQQRDRSGPEGAWESMEEVIAAAERRVRGAARLTIPALNCYPVS